MAWPPTTHQDVQDAVGTLQTAKQDTATLPADVAAHVADGSALDTALRAALVPKWAPSQAVSANDYYLSPAGAIIKRNSNGTTRANYDATEQGLWTVVAGGGGSVSDATTSAKGVVQLAGDLGGTASAPTVPGLATKVNASTYTAGLAAKQPRQLFVSAYQSTPTGQAGAAQDFTFRATHTLTQDVAGFRLALPFGFNLTSGQSACDVVWTGGAALKMSAEINGAIRPITFQGTRAKTADPGGVLVSDLIAADLPAGTKVPIRVKIANGGNYPNTVGTAQGPGATATGDGYTAGSDLTDATTAVTVALTAGYFCHGLIATPVSATVKPSIAFIGDSIVMGTGDATNNGGWTAYASNAVYPNLRLAVGGASAQGWVGSHTYSWPWLEFCTHAVVLLGANDLNTSNGPRTLAQFKADMVSIYTALRNRGLKVYGCTVLPRTNGANTAVASTAFNPGGSSTRGQVNAWIRAGADGLIDGFFETADAVESGRDTGFWASAGLTADGAHPSTAGHQAIAAVVNLATLA